MGASYPCRRRPSWPRSGPFLPSRPSSSSSCNAKSHRTAQEIADVFDRTSSGLEIGSVWDLRSGGGSRRRQRIRSDGSETFLLLIFSRVLKSGAGRLYGGLRQAMQASPRPMRGHNQAHPSDTASNPKRDGNQRNDFP